MAIYELLYTVEKTHIYDAVDDDDADFQCEQFTEIQAEENDEPVHVIGYRKIED